MATAAYHHWDRDGRPWRVARPVKAVGDRLTAHGYVVYFIGNDAHLRSDVPEDHSPFGVTGWPGRHPYGWVLAIDIMPPKAGQKSRLDGKPLPTLQSLGRQLRADKMAGHASAAWIKYMNWEPERDNGGPCWHDSWQPDYRRRPSTDRGHIHLSGRTDFVTSAAADSYDPVARLRTTDPSGGPMSWDADVIELWPPRRTAANPKARAGWVLSQVGRWSEETRGEIAALRGEVAAIRAGQAATLAAVKGDDSAAIIGRIDALQREVTAQAQAEQRRDADLRDLIKQGQDGTLDAAEVVARMGELLAGQNST